MLTKYRIEMTALMVCCAACAQAADSYAARNGGNSNLWPYTSWSTAASNIQAAVDAAQPNDTVWVGPGRYTLPPAFTNYNGATNIVFINKPLTLRGSDSVPDNTIIDGEGKYRGIAWVYPAHSSDKFVVDGLTISNCTSLPDTKGGGLYFKGWTWTATVQNCILVTNGATTIQGGGMFAEQDHYSYASRQIVSNCVFRGNRGSKGAGLFLARFSAPGRIDASVFRDNTAVEQGGGAFLYSQPEIERSEFVGNRVTSAGSSANGGGACYGAGIFRNCLIQGNRSAFNGGGLFTSGGDLRVENCTIANNHSASAGWGPTGGGIKTKFNPANIIVVNSIVCSNRNNYAGDAGIDNITVSTTSSGAYVTNSCLGSTNAIVLADQPFVFVNSMITNPAFADYVGSNYRLQYGSPCMNTGTNVPGIFSQFDLDGNHRVASGTVDMGCYEYVPRGTVITIR